MVSDSKFNGMKSFSLEMGSEETMNSKLGSIDMYSRVKLRALDGIGRVHGGRHGKSAVQNVKSTSAGPKKFGACDEITCGGIRKKMEGRDSIKTKKLAISRGNEAAAAESAKMAHLMAVALGDTAVSPREGQGNRGVREGHTNLGFEFLDSMSDEGTALEMLDALRKGKSKNLGCGYEVGDLVWGKVKSHPWWPGQIFDEAFASSSVCNMKKEGHVLVAFYGDNSYGWFKSTSLIAFDPYYAEKLKQTNAGEFLIAVEEAVDEVNRRAALGLACRCRNPYNFQSMNVQGYFEVDVSGYESGSVYSLKQIERARDGFQPSETLSFVKKLALMPQNDMQTNIKWMKNIAKVLAYRKAVFEEFDETYAQAFGVQLVHPGDSAMVLKDQEKMPSQAPLSQPMIAQTLSKSKGSVKPVEFKDPKKKDKRLSQQRDEQNVLRVNRLIKDSGDHVLQKRAPLVAATFEFSGKKDANGILGRDSAILNPRGPGKDAITMDKKSVLTKISSVDGHMYVSDVKSPTGFSVGFPKNQSSTCITGLSGDNLSVKPLGQNFHQKGEVLVDMKLHRVESSHASQGFQYPLPDELHNVQVACGISPLDPNRPCEVFVTNSNAEKKKPNILKHLGEHLNANKSGTGEIIMRTKEELLLESDQEHTHKGLKTTNVIELARKSSGKSSGTSLYCRVDSQTKKERKGDRTISTASTDSVVALSMVDLLNIKTELPELVADLLALACNPFYGVERNIATSVKHFFLRFRSIVYKKSLALAPSADGELIDIQLTKSPACTVAVETFPIPSKNTRDLPSSLKPLKKRLRPADSTLADEKHCISDRQEEMCVKRLKLLDDKKSLASEKKAGNQNPLGVQEEDRKRMGATVSTKPTKDSLKKQETLTKAVEPTVLLMKFPLRTTMPSVSELKARFGRFGPLNQSATCVFWKSSTCHVVFDNKSDAWAAYSHAVQNRTLFGNRKVNYSLQALKVLGPDLLESSKSGKWLVEEASDEFPPLRSMKARESVGEPGSTVLQQPSVHPKVQRKSYLKKSLDNDMGPTISIPTETPRVKFMLGGNGSDKGEQFLLSNSKITNSLVGNFPNGSESTFHTTINDNIESFQKAIPPPLPPHLALPSQIPEMSENRQLDHLVDVINMKYSQIEAQNSHSYHTTTANNNSIDISHQMLNLLKNCRDIVSDVKRSGYVPYYAL
ncbi:hypothetical protein F0562_034820 [Nyssa sinensis]|uniref:PWWP domain-containing protein n=1 Tax=Nyssa sinensis TaxID=561372 RepID=A0A5J5A8S6_9ASTE|nr:hypothetical protein F0562_034820 [Nyssa sinensis]